MKFTFDHDLHIHSTLSVCCKDEGQTPEAILDYAEREGLKTVCLTNHFWDNGIPTLSNAYKIQNFENIMKALPLPQKEGIRFLFGCETDLNRNLVLGITKENMDLFDFILVPTTHFHMDTNVSPEDKDTAEKCAETWVKRFEAVLNMDLPFHKIGIPHLSCRLIAKNDPKMRLDTLRLIPEEKMRSLFRKAASLGCGIELNQKDLTYLPEEEDAILRPFRIAKEEGCKFYLGSDAHATAPLSGARSIFEKAIEKLSLTEDDKYLLSFEKESRQRKLYTLKR